MLESALTTRRPIFGSQLDTAFLAALLSKHQSPEPITIETEDLIYSLTLGGAKVLGLASEIGSIETGKRADLIALHIGSSIPTFPAPSLTELLFGKQPAQLEYAFVSGTFYFRNTCQIGKTENIIASFVL